jgi:UDP:flavonoid glycosyltransferase YjiC (YdhE family)
MPGWLPRTAVRALYRLADALMIDPLLVPVVADHRRSVGLGPVKRPFDGWFHSPDLVLGLFPEWFAPIPPDWPRAFEATGFVGYDGELEPADPRVDAFLAGGSAPVVITPGSANRQAREFLGAAIDACGALGRRALVLTPHEEQVPHPMPPGVVHAAWAPLGKVLAKAAAFVHHGGIGSTARGLAAGVPQLMMPMAHDQPDNAVRAERLGVGSWIPPRRWSAAAVAPALDRLLGDPAVARACREIAPRVGFEASRRAATEAILRIAR